MSDTVKLIVEIPKEIMEYVKNNDCLSVTYIDEVAKVIQNGIPLDSHDSDYAEAQAYFAGMSYGWEQGQKDLAEKLKAEIETNLSWDMFDEYGNKTRLHKELMEILDNIGKGDSE